MTDINDWPENKAADPYCNICLGDGLQNDGETTCTCIEACHGHQPTAPDAVARLVKAAQVLVDHGALQDREYLSVHLNEKLDAVRAALVAVEESHGR